MNKSILLGSIGGVLSLAVAGGIFLHFYPASDEARVLSVKPILTDARKPRHVCQDVTVTVRPSGNTKERHSERASETNANARTATLVTKTSSAGSAEKREPTELNPLHKQSLMTITERKCHVVFDRYQKLLGFDVRYQWHGQLGSVTMNQRPNGTIPVKNGQLVLNSPAP